MKLLTINDLYSKYVTLNHRLVQKKKWNTCVKSYEINIDKIKSLSISLLANQELSEQDKQMLRHISR